MPPLLLPLPSTTNISFSNLLVDPSSSYTSVLAEATAARTRLFLALKAVVEGQPGSSALNVVDAIHDYWPYLHGIIDCLDSDLLLLKGDPIFAWRPSLTHYAFAPPLLPLPSIHVESLMVSLTLILALSNYAHATLASLPVYEPKPGSSPHIHISAEDEKRTAAGLARAVDLLTQASGVAEWTAEYVCTSLDGIKKATGRLGKHKWPVESAQDAYRGLSMMLLADAHLIAIRKLLLPVLPHILFAPQGPPLPSNHPSPSLLSKLYLHVASLYDSARASFKVNAQEPGSRKLFTKDKDRENSEDAVEGEAIPSLKRYLRKESQLASGLARKWLGVDAGENGKGAKVGEALSWVQEAQSRISELADGSVREKMKGLSIGKASEKRKDERKARKGRIEREMEDIGAWIRAYQRMNDTVAFQPVPLVPTLVVPSGRPIFAAKAFSPPRSKFGPSLADDSSADNADPAASPNTYAGKGNYY